MRKIDLAISHDNDGKSTTRPVTIPLPVGELVSQRVLVMDFVEGVPLNKLKERMEEKGIKAGSPEAKLAGRRILDSLSLAFGRMIFGAGFIHGDPHPGNIFIGEGGKVSLIDCGQFKALPRPQRVQLAELVLAVAEYQDAADKPDVQLDAKEKLADLVQKFGVTVSEEYQNDTNLWCSVALFLFGNADQTLPGGYSSNELDEKSPIKLITSFPQELVLLGRATVLLKGIAKKLEVPFSLADKWGPGCALTLDSASKPSLPLWGKDVELAVAVTSPSSVIKASGDGEKIRFKQGKKKNSMGHCCYYNSENCLLVIPSYILLFSLQQYLVMSILKKWGKGKGGRFSERVIKKLPPKLKSQVLEAELKRQERKDKQAKNQIKNT